MSSIPQLMSGRALEHGIALHVDHGGGGSAKMYVGGQAKATVADGTSHENTVTEGSLEKLAIPANSLVPGSTIRIWASGIVEDNNSTDTLQIFIRLGTNATLPASNVAAFTSLAVDAVDADVYAINGVIQIRTATTAVAMWSYQDPDAAATTPKFQMTAEFAVDTTSVMYLDFSADWSVANADNETNATMFVVDIVNPDT
tara:strand:+ start:28935 stop:29534 length:600 start_codon:yes stop_codon:yes gene_type:complete